jgi:hypothetical protein
MKKTIATLGALLFCAPANATGELDSLMTPADRERLQEYEETRAIALEQAKGGDRRELEELKSVITRPVVPFTGSGFEGDWKCRTIKVGGDLGPLVVYDWFKCKVTDDGSGLMLEKLTGSQRTKGRLFDESENRAVYVGTGYVQGEKAPDYGNGPRTDEVGYAFRTSPDGWRIEFPAPYYESKLDILELKR